MLSLRKINPMARAVGTMGIVATMVGAVTFANLTSNTVALSPNNLTTATAHLNIGPTGCLTGLGNTFQGFNSTTFSTTQPASVNFCINNDGGVPLKVSASVAATAGVLEGNAAAQATTLSIACGPDSAVSGTLNTSWATTFPSTLIAGGSENCTATATLSNSYTSGTGNAIPAFDINFVGTESNS